jgi:uncharacterized protein (TIGR02996 family)
MSLAKKLENLPAFVSKDDLAQLKPLWSKLSRLKYSFEPDKVEAILKPQLSSPLSPYLWLLLGGENYYPSKKQLQAYIERGIALFGQQGRIACAWAINRVFYRYSEVLLEPLKNHVRELIPLSEDRRQDGTTGNLVIEAIHTGLWSDAAALRNLAGALAGEAGEAIVPSLQQAILEASPARQKRLHALLQTIQSRPVQVESTLPPLEEAEAALKAGELAGAALALRRAWESSKDEAIARLLLSLPVPCSMPYPEGESARNLWWEGLAARQDPADLPALLSALWPKTQTAAQTRIDALSRFPPDPRIVQFLVDQLAMGMDRQSCLKVFEVLEKTGWAGGLTEDELGYLRNFYLISSTVVPSYTLSQLLKPKAPVPDSPLQKLLPLKSHSQALLEAILSDPTADTPRLVYADYLIEQGNPRGEFIQLQLKPYESLTPKEERRLEELRSKHYAGWSRISPGIVPNTTQFARGFPSSATLQLYPLILPRLQACLEGRLLEIVDFDPRCQSAEVVSLLEQRLLPALHTITAFPSHITPKYCPGIHSLTLHYEGDVRVRLEAFPDLKHLLVQPDQLEGLVDTLQYISLSRIHITSLGYYEEEEPGRVYESITALPNNIKQVAFGMIEDEYLLLERDALGNFSRLLFDTSSSWELMEILEQLPVGSLMLIEGKLHYALDRSYKKQFKAAVDRHIRAEKKITVGKKAYGE